jgi:hypothetical protein
MLNLNELHEFGELEFEIDMSPASIRAKKSYQGTTYFRDMEDY